MSFFTDKVLKGLDEGLLTEIVLIGIKKAFDSLDREIMLQKPEQSNSQKPRQNGLNRIFLKGYFL